MASFNTLEDIETELVRKRAQGAAEVHLRDLGGIRPTAFILSTYDPIAKEQKPAPEVLCVGGDGSSSDELRGPIRMAAMKTHAVGVVYFQEVDGTLRVSLEHKELGDHEWTAKASRRAMGTLGDASAPAEVTRFLAQRFLQ